MIRVAHRARPVVVFVATAAALGAVTALGAGAATAHPFAVGASAPKPAAIGAVHGVKAFVAGENITLVWKNPKPALGRVVVRYHEGAHAPTRSGGHSVAVATRHSTSVTLRHLRRDTRYTAAVWLRKGDSWSARRSTTFTTDARSSIGTGTYVGTVTDRAGNPLQGASVALDPFDVLDNSVAAHTETDAAGKYVLVLPAGAYFVEIDGSQATGGTADATGYVGGYDFLHIRAGRTRHGPARQLRAGAAVSGQVTDRTGAPLAGLSVYSIRPFPYIMEDDSNSSFVALFDDGEQARTTTDADGRYSLQGLAMTPQQVCVSGAPELYPAYLAKCSPNVIVRRPRTSVEEPSTVLPTGSGGAISGRVTSPSGHGVGRVLVDVVQQRGDSGGTVRTADDGSFQVSDLAAGTYRLCVDPTLPNLARRAGFQSGCPGKQVVVTDGHDTREDVSLHPGGALTGTVTGADGRPLAGVEVNTGNYFVGAETDATGQYTLNGLAGRRYRVCFDTTAQLPLRPTGTGARSACLPEKVRARVGAVRTGLDIALKRGGAITGVVLDANRHPVPSVDVSVEGFRPDVFADVETAADGSFRVPDLGTGTSEVCFDLVDEFGPGREFCRNNVRVEAGKVTDGVDELLPAMSSVSVAVHDASGHPVAAADATVLRQCHASRFECDHTTVLPDAPPVKVVASEMTDEKGRVTIPHLKPGHYAVCAFGYDGATPAGAPATGYADACSGSTFDVVASPNSTTAVTVPLPDGGAVSGRVTDAAGHPLRNVVVHVSGSAADDFDSEFGDLLDDGPGEYSRTDASGRYTIRSVAPGDSTVCMDASRARGGTSGAGYADQCIGGQPGGRTDGTPVPVEADLTVAAPTLALTSTSGISGTISSIGKSRDIEVGVFDDSGNYVRGDDRSRPGSYSITGLPAGSYRVCVSDRHDARCYVDAPWNGRKPPSDATVVTTGAGKVTAGIDVTMHR